MPHGVQEAVDGATISATPAGKTRTTTHAATPHMHNIAYGEPILTRAIASAKAEQSAKDKEGDASRIRQVLAVKQPVASG